MSVAQAVGEGPRRALPAGWQWVWLGDVCTVNPRRPAIERPDDAPTSFVPMSAVAEEGRGLVAVETRPYRDVAKGYTYFAEGDVLFAKITPCMQNGKHAVARGLHGGLGFGSTEFHVLRPTDGVTPEWVHAFIRQPWVLCEATAHFTGAVGQQRVPVDFLANLALPLPPLPEQRRIASMLTEQLAAVDRARAAVQAQLDAAKALPAAYLRAVFDSDEAKRWPQHPIQYLGDAARGDIVQTGPFGAQLPSSEFTPTGVPVLNIGNVQWGELALTRLDHVSPEKAQALARYKVQAGDLLFTRSGTVGRSAVVPPECSGWLISYHLLRVALDPRKALSEFVTLALRGSGEVRKQVKRAAEGRGSTRDGVNSTILADLEVPVPSLPDQVRVVAELESRIKGVRRLEEQALVQRELTEHLPAALLRRAFEGGL